MPKFLTIKLFPNQVFNQSQLQLVGETAMALPLAVPEGFILHLVIGAEISDTSADLASQLSELINSAMQRRSNLIITTNFGDAVRRQVYQQFQD